MGHIKSQTPAIHELVPQCTTSFAPRLRTGRGSVMSIFIKDPSVLLTLV